MVHKCRSASPAGLQSKGSGGGDIEETFTYHVYHVRGSGERRPESAQKIRACAAPLPYLSARNLRLPMERVASFIKRSHLEK
jgi:hypothetical protein